MAPRNDLVAGGEAAHAWAGLLDHSGQVEAEDGGQHGPGVGRRPGPDLGIQRVHPAGGHPDQDLAVAGHGLVDLGQGQVAAELLEYHRMHGSEHPIRPVRIRTPPTCTRPASPRPAS